MEGAFLGCAIVGSARPVLCDTHQVANVGCCVLVVLAPGHSCSVDFGERVGCAAMRRDDVWFAVIVGGTFILSVAGLVAMYLHLIVF